MKTNPTPGYKTTEFWLTLGLNLVAAAMTYLNTIDATWAIIAVTILNSVYTLGRMGTKTAVERAKTTVPLLLACGIIAAALPSCKNFTNPSGYIVNTVPYTKQIQNTPEKVLVEPADVKEVGGFQVSGGVKLLTDKGEIDISPDGLQGEMVIDLTSGK